MTSIRALGFAAVFFAFMGSISLGADAAYWGGSNPNCGAAIPRSTGGY